jgi:APA family basic amino acid/polyamine antiporter
VFGVRQGGAVQVATTVLKVVRLLAIAVLGFLFVQADTFGGFNPSGQSVYGALSAVAAAAVISASAASTAGS